MNGELVYGCMGLGGAWSDAPLTTEDVDIAERAVRVALDIGITWFDQADIYRNGKSEEALGQVLSRDPGLRDRVRIQTKCGIRLGENGLEAYYDLSKASILERVHGSLERLGVDRVDVLLLHRPDPLMEPDEIAAAFAELRSAGKVGAFGVSNMSASQMEYLRSIVDEPLVVNQLEMSLRKRDWVEAGVLVNHPEGAGISFPEGTIEYCQAHDVRLQAWGALAQGVYSGAAPADRSLAEERTAVLVSTMAGEKNTTPEAIVLGWLMRHPAGIEPVIGTADPVRIRACGDAARQAAAMTGPEWYSLYTAARGRPVP
ncbi:MAG: aldo/keto reductase [Amycolatopsis sp.]|jgi:predicted oxidoreductase|uniref:aldo/keto reductase n=1 Tax=Amycolatopsis sp. TaxID=37632 RepID=UPI00262116F8|nr:aldo/keto reductase [Amycolatopsis sp.]MCU1685867.1 aldo/keto reductase [Amycolatopsis sp.]